MSMRLLLRVAQPSTDKWYTSLIAKVTAKPREYPHWRVNERVLYKHVSTKIPELEDEHDSWKKVIPKDQRKELLRLIHSAPTSGHSGVTKLYAKHRHNKLAPKYVGPFVIRRKMSDVTYDLADQSGKERGIWHVKDMKPGPDENDNDSN
ncbi:hypothetical protein CBL_20022 [Carabus blaptoides fortunei]